VARNARGRPLTEAEEAEILTSIAEVTAERTDLLTHAASLAVGFSEGTPDEPRQRQAADMLIKFGAGSEPIPSWVRKAADAPKPREASLTREAGSKAGPGKVVGLACMLGRPRPLLPMHYPNKYRSC
jgi:hypothetical protein